MSQTDSKKKNQTLVIVGLIALIVVLMVCVRLIFDGLEAVLPQPEPSLYTQLNNEKGQPAAYGARLLGEDERQAGDIQEWLESSRDWVSGESADAEHSAFWLYRQGADEYVLYLPGQDRALSAADLTAAEEKDEDGEITLVLRARTPENGGEAVPEEQLFAFQTQSEQWRGIRVKVILDGRERHVYKLTSTKLGQLYSLDEMYIGRDIGG